MYGVGWEVFAFRSWIVTYLAERQGAEGAQNFWLTPPDVAFATALAGIPASVWIGTMAARIDRERLLMATTAVSMAIIGGIAVFVNANYAVLLALCFLFSMTSFGRSSATTAGMMSAAQDSVRGATMAAHSFVAFLSGVTSPLAVGFVLDMSGILLGRTSWTGGFLALAVGSVISLCGYWIAARDEKRRAT
jgi:MFS family permease